MNQHPERMPDQPDDEIVVPVVQEELVTGRRRVKTGSVRVHKRVEKTSRTVESPLMREHVEVKRVPVNRVVTTVPEVRSWGDSVIIPVVEEEIVVTKRLVLKEEIHLIKHRTQENKVQNVELERETAEVHRLDAQGRTVDQSAAQTTAGSWPPERPPMIKPR
jgi:uncharacterized protein (TIGR02271 family)